MVAPENRILSSTEPVALVFNCHVNGLGIIRSLGEMGVPVLALDHDPQALGLASRYAARAVCPNVQEDESAFISYLIDLGSKLRTKGVLYPTNDAWLVAVSKCRELLQPYFVLPFAKWELIERCVVKPKMYALARDAGVPIPKTVVVSGLQRLEASKKEIPLPCIVKPASPWEYPAQLGMRVRGFSTWDALRTWFGLNDATITREGVALVVQELVQGRTEDLYTFASYSDRAGKVIGHGVIRKVSQHPPDAGTIRMGEVVQEDRIVELGTTLLERIGFHGLANVEFKRDARDGEFKLMEINPRSGMSNYFVTRAGCNLAFLAYCDALGRKIPGLASRGSNSGFGHIWLVLLPVLSDMLRRAIRHPLSGYAARTTLKEIKLMLTRRKVFGVASWRDPKPGWSYLVWALKRALLGRRATRSDLR
jgi:D-aspartate ligase